MGLRDSRYVSKNYFFSSLFILFVFCLSTGCEKKIPADIRIQQRKALKKRIIYYWDLNVNSACFLLQGKKKCGYARLVKLTDTLFSIRIHLEMFQDFPLLKFTLRDIKAGKKKAPDADVSYQEANIFYTNFDYAGVSFLEISREGSLLEGFFSFRIRSNEGKWVNFTQGKFVIRI